MDVGAAYLTDTEAAELVHPRARAFHHSAGRPRLISSLPPRAWISRARSACRCSGGWVVEVDRPVDRRRTAGGVRYEAAESSHHQVDPVPIVSSSP
jgi:hypothetical protein